MTGIDAAFQALFAKRPQVIKPGLERINAALRYLAVIRPRPSTPTVLIAGTNGKGTTSTFLWQLLSGLGVRTGLFTSPHLVHFRERFTLTATEVSDELLLATLADLGRQLPPALYAELSFFEVNTLLALELFAAAKSDINLLEVGLGGRWDSTNAVDPCLAVITSIGLDHQQWLGSTTAAIAGEKAGIMRRQVPVIWGGDDAGDEAAVAVLKASALALDAPFWQQPEHFSDVGDGTLRVALPLPGAVPQVAPWPRAMAGQPRFLRGNLLKAAAACTWLCDHGPLAGRGFTLAAALAGFDRGPRTPLRARFERLQVDSLGRAHRLLLDVCHNPAGAAALVSALGETKSLPPSGRLPAFVSVLSDKDYNDVLAVLAPVCAPLVLFAVASERSWSQDQLAPRFQGLPFYPSFAAAWAAHTPPPEALTLICGSVHAVGEVLVHFAV